ncbi:MAG: aminoglycoside phosphotransferase family protein [Microthrixaceae bacterium]
MSAADLTPEWLTHALAPLTGGSQVTAVTAQAIGTGQVAETQRLTLSWATPSWAQEQQQQPLVVIAKVPTTDPVSLSAAKTMRNYLLEVMFYSELAATVDVNSPQCFFAGHDAESDGFALLLADLAPAEQGDQLVGCSADQASAAVNELVGLHAPRWNDPSLESFDLAWLNRGGAEGATFAQLVAPLFPAFLERYADRLSPELSQTVSYLGNNLTPYLANRAGPRTLTHNDFRLDNLLFGAERVAVVDFQTVSYGYPLADLAYFIGGSLLQEDRAEAEEALVRQYLAGLGEHGVQLSWHDCWEWYRRYAFEGLLMAVMASMGVERTQRGDDMFMVMAERSGRHALDLESALLI